MKIMAKSAHIWAAIVAMMVVLAGSAMAQSEKILVPADQDQASKDKAEPYDFLAWGNAWDIHGVSIDPGNAVAIHHDVVVESTWLFTSGHGVIDETNGSIMFDRLVYGFGADSFTQLDNHDYLDANLVILHPTRDLALVRLEGLARDENGELVELIEFYDGPLNEDQIVLLGGFGDYGSPEQGGGILEDQWDGFRRAAYGRFSLYYVLNPDVALMVYDPSITLAGIASQGDSGGFAAIEVDGVPKLIGLNVIVVGSGTNTKTGAEYIPPGSPVLDWIDDTIAANQVGAEGEGEGEGDEDLPHSADTDADWRINLSEVLRVIQVFNMGGYHCADEDTEDGFKPGADGLKDSCAPHKSDYAPQDWDISLSELLRGIQLFNSAGYHACLEGEDGYCLGTLADEASLSR